MEHNIQPQQPSTKKRNFAAQNFMRVEEVAQALGISTPQRKVIHKLNAELR